MKVPAQTDLTIAASLLGLSMRAQTAPSPQPAPKGPRTPAATIQLAESNYPAIRAAQQRQEAAQDAIAVAKTAYLPGVDLQWKISRATKNRSNVVLIPQPIVPVPEPLAWATTSPSNWISATGVLLGW